ncbi:MAG: copper-binding protein [Pseudomonadota bacterium]
MRKLILAACALALPAMAMAVPHEWTKAEVVKVEPEKARVMLDHERIASIGMEPMLMPFKVDKAVDLKKFKAGDKVRFTVSVKDDHLVVGAMEKLK